MGKSKREERKQRSEEQKAEQERLKKRQNVRARAAIVVVVLGIAAAGWFVTRRDNGAVRADGKVWSAAHGHWHDK
jgi:uncharacterized protein HemX